MWRILSIQPQPTGESLTVSDFLSLLLSALWSLAVWAYFGAAISRVAAVQLATGEQVGWGASLRWARAKWLAYFSSPLLPMLGVALAVLPILVLGLLMRANFLAVLAALVWPLVLAGGFVMTVLLAGVLLGWPLMWATISVEGTDSFDALNRTYAYVFQRPLRYLLLCDRGRRDRLAGLVRGGEFRRGGHLAGFLGRQLGRGIAANSGVDGRLGRRRRWPTPPRRSSPSGAAG